MGEEVVGVRVGVEKKKEKKRKKEATSRFVVVIVFRMLFHLSSLSVLTHQPDRKPHGLERARTLQDGDAHFTRRGALDRESGREASRSSADDADVDVCD